MDFINEASISEVKREERGQYLPNGWWVYGRR